MLGKIGVTFLYVTKVDEQDVGVFCALLDCFPYRLYGLLAEESA